MPWLNLLWRDAGFLVTCDFRREKSATREAAALLQRYMPQETTTESPSLTLPPQLVDVEGSPQQQLGEKLKQMPESRTRLSILKLAGRGIALLKLPTAEGKDGIAANRAHAQRAFAAVLAAVESGGEPRAQHCQRLVPIHATAPLEAAVLSSTAGDLADLALPVLEGKKAPSFAVALKSRQTSGSENNSNPSKQAAGADSAGMDRGSIIKAVAAGFESAIKERLERAVKVDLKDPDVVLALEVLPFSSRGQMHVGLSVLPAVLCTLKPKLQARSIGCDKPRAEVTL
jgi:tRNA(Ser,Leu) C12 N-acetylase TAN1